MFKNRREYFAAASTNNCEITDIHIALIQNVKFALINKRVYSWGSTNEMGLQGRETSVSTPTLIQNLPAIGSIAGDINTMFAVATNGDVYGWGSNADNLLTPEAITNVTTPIKIQGLSNIVKISVASVEPKSVNPQNPQLCICALDTIGNVYMWGNNKGNHFGSMSVILQKTPILIQLSITVKDILCTTIGVFFIDTDNKLYTTSTELGRVNGMIMFLDITNIKQISGTKNIVVLKNDGTVYGLPLSNNQFQLGTNLIPTSSQFYKLDIDNVSKIVANGINTYYIKSTGELYATGINKKLVNNNTDNLITPTQINIPRLVTNVIGSEQILSVDGPFNLAVINNSELIEFGGLEFTDPTQYPFIIVTPTADMCAPPGSIPPEDGSASSFPGSASSFPGSASASIVVPSGASSSFMPVQQTPDNQQKSIDCTGSSASFLPYCASASIASSYASYNNTATMPTMFEKAFSFKGLLDQQESAKKKRKEETVSVQEKGGVQVVQKTTTIRIPAKEAPRCDRLAAQQQYNPGKTYGGNLIDWVVCGTQDLVKRISKFF